MGLADIIASYLLLSGGHTLSHLSVANQTGAPASIDYRSGGERWMQPDSEYDWNAPTFRPGQKMRVRTTPGAEPGHIQIGMPKAGVPAETDRHGAGFEGQDVISHAMDTPESASANAVYKLLYASGLTMGRNMSEWAGDIDAMEKQSGNRYTKEMIVASVLADLMKVRNPKQNWDVGFSTFGTGQPGLKLNYRW